MLKVFWKTRDGKFLGFYCWFFYFNLLQNFQFFLIFWIFSLKLFHFCLNFSLKFSQKSSLLYKNFPSLAFKFFHLSPLPCTLIINQTPNRDLSLVDKNHRLKRITLFFRKLLHLTLARWCGFSKRCKCQSIHRCDTAEMNLHT